MNSNILCVYKLIYEELDALKPVNMKYDIIANILTCDLLLDIPRLLIIPFGQLLVQIFDTAAAIVSWVAARMQGQKREGVEDGADS